MGKHVIVGAGAVGRGVARELAAAGHEVVMVSRSGRAPTADGVRSAALDATDAAALTAVVRGADVLYNCANPANYTHWAREWPPLAASLLQAATESGAGYVIMGNLYGYGPVPGPIRPDLPLATPSANGRIRVRMWEEALAAHRAGRVRVTEARASDFIGPDSGANSHLGDRVIPRILAGKKVRAFAALDEPHSWTFVDDVARTLVAVGSDDRSWGRAWHVPTNPALTQREAFVSIAAMAGVPMPPVGTLSGRAVRAVGVAVPLVRALGQQLYQFDRPFVIDATATTATFGIEPTPWDECVRATLAAYRTDAVPASVVARSARKRRRYDAGWTQGRPVASAAMTDDIPKHRYDARLANEIEARWQDRWDAEHTFWAPNPTGLLSEGAERIAGREPLFVLDMFPYPSGAGLHVGHPLGYIGTDVYARFARMSGKNVLHAMGYDAFGLPAEQYAVQTGQHPRVTTEANIATMRRQLRALGLGHDSRRGIATTDVGYYRWTQWIFLQIFNSWYDEDTDGARPIDELIPILESDPQYGWAELDERGRRELVDSYRLAYLHEAPVNWCPALGTVLANEEVTADGRSERGNHPVYRRPLKQWMLRITAFADRLLADLDLLDWNDSIKQMQRNWIGRSTGASVDFGIDGHDDVITVFTTRPDTLFGATYMVLAPEHPLVDAIVPTDWPGANFGDDLSEVPAPWKGIFGQDVGPAEAVRRYRDFAAQKSELERQAEGKEKTGVFTGAFAVNPVDDRRIPIFVADYVLMGYGTGAIMAVPAQDQRDWDFAAEFDLPIIRTVRPPDDFDGEAYLGDGPAMNSGFLDGLEVGEAKAAMTEWLVEQGVGEATVNYKLRDWLFSRQRYWGEPFPIVYDDLDLPVALPEGLLPVELPEIIDFEPEIVADDAASVPAPPLSRAEQWVTVELDLGDGPKRYRRELNTMPQWAGSCWYYLRYLDPTNEDEFVGAEAERYWMQPGPGGVKLYVGGVEHAVLHLLYARFWHKVLFDLGHVSTPEPFQRLFNQGYIQAPAFTDARGQYVEAAEVVEVDGTFTFHGEEVSREFGKIGKSLKNMVTPDDIFADYGADTLRLYEMAMGPLDASRPWSTRDIVGVHRFLQRLWRNVVDEDTGAVVVTDAPADDETRRLLHRTIAEVREDMATLGFNTAVAKLITLNNRLTQVATESGAPREVVEPLVLMLAPLAPHVAEELWSRLGHADTLTYEDFPVADPTWLVVDSVEVVVQVNGKVRGKVVVRTDADDVDIEAAARGVDAVAALLADTTVRKVVVVPDRLINFVVG